MSLEAAIFERGKTFAPLTALLGTNPTKLYHLQAPQDVVAPYVTFMRVSGARVHVMMRDSLARPRIQFDVFGRTPLEVTAVSAQVLACYDHWYGTLGGVEVQSSIIESEGVMLEADEVTLYPRRLIEAEMTVTL